MLLVDATIDTDVSGCCQSVCRMSCEHMTDKGSCSRMGSQGACALQADPLPQLRSQTLIYLHSGL